MSVSLVCATKFVKHGKMTTTFNSRHQFLAITHSQADMVISGRLNKQKAQNNTIVKMQFGHVHPIQRQLHQCWWAQQMILRSTRQSLRMQRGIELHKSFVFLFIYWKHCRTHTGLGIINFTFRSVAQCRHVGMYPCSCGWRISQAECAVLNTCSKFMLHEHGYASHTWTLWTYHAVRRWYCCIPH